VAFSLSEKTVERVCQVLERDPQVMAAVLCGSRVKGNARPGSGIDLTLHGGGLCQGLFQQSAETFRVSVDSAGNQAERYPNEIAVSAGPSPCGQKLDFAAG
jgi:hypothetical protein